MIAMAKSVPIENYIGQSPRMSGQKMFFRCPFHEEKTGSFCVFLKDNTYHCFGCGKSGDAISFIEEFEKIEFAEAVRFLIGQRK
jgi:DNA primase